MLVEEIMLPEVITVNDFDLIEDVIVFLARRKVNGAPVVDLEQRPVGYFSSPLFFRQLIESAQKEVAITGNFISAIKEKIKEFSSQEVSEFMIADFDYLEADEGLEEAIDLFLDTDLELVPVVQEGKIVGVVNHNRILQYFIENGKK